ncbi:ATP-binding protein [Nocardioides sp.]|uniref:ATP-binding protein n=1 Tax=Nocardioides sp. TaxID=35761 RepID=UPI0027325422|nr:ATP-binding protein [Nocardioides sp.]MDP3889785.1 ATP-binding protein [Nocardioides sp.]
MRLASPQQSSLPEAAPWPRDRTWAVGMLVTLSAVLLLAMVSVSLAPPGSRVAAWWPAAGLSVALVALTRPGRRWLALSGLTAASLLGNYLAGRPVEVALGFTAANVTEAAIVAWWISTGRRGPPRMSSIDDFWRLVVATVLGAATAGLLAGVTVAVLQDGSLLLTWRAVLASHAAAVLTIVPLALWPPSAAGRPHPAETALQTVALTVTLVLAFGPLQTLPVAFLPLPFLVWGAYRLGPRVAALQLLGAGVITSVLTTAGRGPFALLVEAWGAPPEMIGTILQANLLAYALVTLPLALTARAGQRALSEARRSGSTLSSVMAATTGTSIIGTDASGQVTFFNVGAERLLGRRAADVVGRVSPEVFHDPLEIRDRAEELGIAPGFGAVTHAVAHGEELDVRDWTYLRSDGSRVTVSLRVSPRFDDHRQLVGYLGVAEDVTERRRVEHSLRETLERERQVVERLAHLDQVKTDFVASVSHELRTPITSVVGYLEIILGGDAGPIPERQRRLLDRVDRNARRLLGLIEDLLTLSRIEAGTFELVPRPVDLTTVLENALEALEGHRAASGAELRVEVPGTPLVIDGDGDQLERVVINLVSNALKFTPSPGEVTLGLAAASEGAVLTVSDTGVGIPEVEQVHLFERFFRASTAADRATPGTGLGLSIVRTIVTAHGGDIVCDSAPGRGTTFTVHLPRQQTGAAQLPQQRGEAQRARATRPSSQTGPSDS